VAQRFVYHARVIGAESNDVGLEQRLSNLQAQIDAMRHAAGDDPRPLEQRLSTLTDYSTTILKQWSATSDRHAKAVSQLEAHLRELGDAGNRLQQDANQRLQDLERIVQQEWSALRDIHEQPVRRLVEQAASLTEVCIATANTAQHGFDRAEARLATLEHDFHRTTSELTRDVQAVLAEVRQLAALAPRQQLTADTPAWPLDGVTRLHHQLREADDHARELPSESPHAVGAVSESLAPRQRVFAGAERSVEEPVPQWASESQPHVQPEPQPQRSVLAPIAMAAALVVLIALAGGFAWRLQRDVSAATQRAEQSQAQSKLAAETASRQAAEREEAAARQLVAARDLATRAQTIGDVLAAPDLVRYALAGTPLLPSATGQLLWSRSRGFVFSASGLPAPPPNTAYQVWLLTRTGPVSATTFTSDPAGRITVAGIVSVPRPVLGAIVTTERKEGATAPSREPILAHFPVAAPPPS